MNNTYKYTFKDFDLLMERMTDLREQMVKLQKRNINTEITIQPLSKNEWVLKLDIYDEKGKNTEEISVFKTRVE